jgi:AmiR/NasT family two-component response regulator
VLLSPFPRRREASRPDAAFRRFGLVLLGFICLDKASGQSPTLPHQPGVHIGAVRQLASRDHALVLPKAKAARPEVPVIMITAYGDAETKRKALENGAEALFTKPIDFRALRSEIDTRVERAA